MAIVPMLVGSPQSLHISSWILVGEPSVDATSGAGSRGAELRALALICCTSEAGTMTLLNCFVISLLWMWHVGGVSCAMSIGGWCSSPGTMVFAGKLDTGSSTIGKFGSHMLYLFSASISVMFLAFRGLVSTVSTYTHCTWDKLSP